MTAAAVAMALAATPQASANDYVRLSGTPAGPAGNGASYAPATSGDGQVTAFVSEASDLVEGDGNGRCDVFVRDGGATQRVSVRSGGAESTTGSSCLQPAISADGRVVAFVSNASDLVEGDTNGTEDVFVHDRASGETTRVSVGPEGQQADRISWHPDVSADGRLVAFDTASASFDSRLGGNTTHVYLRDLAAGTTEMLTRSADGAPAEQGGGTPSLSGDGRFVAYTAWDGTVPGDWNLAVDVFVLDRETGSLEPVSVRSDGTFSDDVFADGSVAPDLSADGRFVAFQSDASDLVAGGGDSYDDVFRHDRETGETLLASHDATGAATGGINPSISADGSKVAFDRTFGAYPDFPNDVAMYDAGTGSVVRLTWGDNSDWTGFPRLSGDGSEVVFTTAGSWFATDDGNGTVDVYRRSTASPASEPPPPPPPADVTPPTMQVDYVEAPATGPDGAAVSYTAYVWDDSDPAPTVTCSPPSGSRFPIGTSSIECTATDASGNQATATFYIGVIGADVQLSYLPDMLNRESELSAAVRKTLVMQVNAAREAYLAGKSRTACGHLDAFARTIRGSKLSAPAKDFYLGEAKRIRAVIGC
jgi:Tol biopolymer transport system component